MGALIRSFVALSPPPELRRAAAELGERLSRRFAPRTLRLVPEAQLHLTLVFLGNVNAAALPELERQLGEACRPHRPFTLTVKGLGVFPDRRRARVLWCGVDGDLAALTALSDSVCRALGHPLNRSFHLTLGRFKAPPPAALLAALLDTYAGHEVGTWPVDEVVLYASKLTPQGAVHTPLARLTLGQMS